MSAQHTVESQSSSSCLSLHLHDVLPLWLTGSPSFKLSTSLCEYLSSHVLRRSNNANCSNNVGGGGGGGPSSSSSSSYPVPPLTGGGGLFGNTQNNTSSSSASSASAPPIPLSLWLREGEVQHFLKQITNFFQLTVLSKLVTTTTKGGGVFQQQQQHQKIIFTDKNAPILLSFVLFASQCIDQLDELILGLLTSSFSSSSSSSGSSTAPNTTNNNININSSPSPLSLHSVLENLLLRDVPLALTRLLALLEGSSGGGGNGGGGGEVSFAFPSQVLLLLAQKGGGGASNNKGGGGSQKDDVTSKKKHSSGGGGNTSKINSDEDDDDPSRLRHTWECSPIGWPGGWWLNNNNQASSSSSSSSTKNSKQQQATATSSGGASAEGGGGATTTTTSSSSGSGDGRNNKATASDNSSSINDDGDSTDPSARSEFLVNLFALVLKLDRSYRALQRRVEARQEALAAQESSSNVANSNKRKKGAGAGGNNNATMMMMASATQSRAEMLHSLFNQSKLFGFSSNNNKVGGGGGGGGGIGAASNATSGSGLTQPFLHAQALHRGIVEHVFPHHPTALVSGSGSGSGSGSTAVSGSSSPITFRPSTTTTTTTTTTPSKMHENQQQQQNGSSVPLPVVGYKRLQLMIALLLGLQRVRLLDMALEGGGGDSSSRGAAAAAASERGGWWTIFAPQNSSSSYQHEDFFTRVWNLVEYLAQGGGEKLTTTSSSSSSGTSNSSSAASSRSCHLILSAAPHLPLLLVCALPILKSDTSTTVNYTEMILRILFNQTLAPRYLWNHWLLSGSSSGSGPSPSSKPAGSATANDSSGGGATPNASSSSSSSVPLWLPKPLNFFIPLSPSENYHHGGGENDQRTAVLLSLLSCLLPQQVRSGAKAAGSGAIFLTSPLSCIFTLLFDLVTKCHENSLGGDAGLFSHDDGGFSSQCTTQINLGADSKDDDNGGGGGRIYRKGGAGNNEGDEGIDEEEDDDDDALLEEPGGRGRNGNGGGNVTITPVELADRIINVIWEYVFVDPAGCLNSSSAITNAVTTNTTTVDGRHHDIDDDDVVKGGSKKPPPKSPTVPNQAKAIPPPLHGINSDDGETTKKSTTMMAIDHHHLGGGSIPFFSRLQGPALLSLFQCVLAYDVYRVQQFYTSTCGLTFSELSEKVAILDDPDSTARYRYSDEQQKKALLLSQQLSPSNGGGSMGSNSASKEEDIQRMDSNNTNNDDDDNNNNSNSPNPLALMLNHSIQLLFGSTSIFVQAEIMENCAATQGTTEGGGGGSTTTTTATAATTTAAATTTLLDAEEEEAEDLDLLLENDDLLLKRRRRLKSSCSCAGAGGVFGIATNNGSSASLRETMTQMICQSLGEIFVDPVLVSGLSSMTQHQQQHIENIENCDANSFGGGGGGTTPRGGLGNGSLGGSASFASARGANTGGGGAATETTSAGGGITHRSPLVKTCLYWCGQLTSRLRESLRILARRSVHTMVLCERYRDTVLQVLQVFCRVSPTFVLENVLLELRDIIMDNNHVHAESRVQILDFMGEIVIENAMVLSSRQLQHYIALLFDQYEEQTRLFFQEASRLKFRGGDSSHPGGGLGSFGNDGAASNLSLYSPSEGLDDPSSHKQHVNDSLGGVGVANSFDDPLDIVGGSSSSSPGNPSSSTMMYANNPLLLLEASARSCPLLSLVARSVEKVTYLVMQHYSSALPSAAIVTEMEKLLDTEEQTPWWETKLAQATPTWGSQGFGFASSSSSHRSQVQALTSTERFHLAIVFLRKQLLQKTFLLAVKIGWPGSGLVSLLNTYAKDNGSSGGGGSNTSSVYAYRGPKTSTPPPSGAGNDGLNQTTSLLMGFDVSIVAAVLAPVYTCAARLIRNPFQGASPSQGGAAPLKSTSGSGHGSGGATTTTASATTDSSAGGSATTYMKRFPQFRAFWLMSVWYSFTEFRVTMSQPHRACQKCHRALLQIIKEAPPLLHFVSNQFTPVLADIASMERSKAVLVCKCVGGGDGNPLTATSKATSSSSGNSTPICYTWDTQRLLLKLKDLSPDLALTATKLQFGEMFLLFAIAELEMLRCGWNNSSRQHFLSLHRAASLRHGEGNKKSGGGGASGLSALLLPPLQILPSLHYHRIEMREFEMTVDLKNCVKKLDEVLMMTFTNTVAARLDPCQQLKVLLPQMQGFLLHFALNIAAVRQVAKTRLVALVHAFPAVTVDRRSLTLLLNLIQLVGQAAEQDVMHFCEQYGFEDSPALPYVASAGFSERQELHQALIAFANIWLRTARAHAPHLLFESLLSFVLEHQEAQVTMVGSHSGTDVAMSVLLESGTKTNPLQGRSGAAVLTPTRLRNFSQILMKRSAVNGELSHLNANILASIVASNSGSSLSSSSAPSSSPFLLFPSQKGSTDSPVALAVHGFSITGAHVLHRLKTVVIENLNSVSSSMAILTEERMAHPPPPSSPFHYKGGGPLKEGGAAGGGSHHHQPAVKTPQQLEQENYQNRVQHAKLVQHVKNLSEVLYLSGAWICNVTGVLLAGGGAVNNHHNSAAHHQHQVVTSSIQQQLRWLIQGPIQIFSPLALQAGAQVWKWVLSEQRTHAVTILHHIVVGWTWTITQRLGLFDGIVPNVYHEIERGSSAMCPDSENGRGMSHLYADDYGTNSPHKILCGFIAEHYVDKVSPFAFDPSCLRLLLIIVSRSVESESFISLKNSSFSEFMRCSLLFLTIVNHCHHYNDQLQNSSIGSGQHFFPIATLGKLRQKIYRVILRWFSKKASWYHTQEFHAAINDAHVLDRLIHALHWEQKTLSKSPSGFVDFDMRVLSSHQQRSSHHVDPNSGMENGTGGGPLDQSYSYYSARDVGEGLVAISGGRKLIAPTTSIISGGESMSESAMSIAMSLNAARNKKSRGGGGSISGAAVTTSSGKPGGGKTGGGGGGGGSNAQKTLIKYAAQHVSEEHSRLHNLLGLLRLLLKHELQRLIVWTKSNSQQNHGSGGSGGASVDVAKLLPDFDSIQEAIIQPPLWRAYVDTARMECPRVAVQFAQRFPNAAVVHYLTSLINESPASFAHIPEAVEYYVNEQTIAQKTPALHLWVDANILTSLKFLAPSFVPERQVVKYALRSLAAVPGDCLIFYLPQIIQCLRYDQDNAIASFLIFAAKNNSAVAHQILWALQTEADTKAPPIHQKAPGSAPEAATPVEAPSAVKKPNLTPAQEAIAAGNKLLVEKCKTLLDQIQGSFSERQRQWYLEEFSYLELITDLSGLLKPIEKPKRKEKLREMLTHSRFNLGKGTPYKRVYIPTNPEYQIVEVISTTASPMQSAAKCPIFVQFKCRLWDIKAVEEELEMATLNAATTAIVAAKPALDTNGSSSSNDVDVEESKKTTASTTKDASVQEDAKKNPVTSPAVEEECYTDPNAPILTKACIFKMGDDCRQDQIALQGLDLFKRIFDSINVPFFLYPYRVITTGKDSGIIECVPQSMSRDQIGKLVEGNLGEFFVQQFGHPQTLRFKKARDCFIRSMASYSVASFILNMKDRHNGNILLDAEGHIIHIDFGFIFDYSPGGDINFESSPFKLTREFLQLMGDADSIGENTPLAQAMADPEVYYSFVDATTRCFLAVREFSQQLCIMVEMMLESGLPCFKPYKTIFDLQERLAVGKSESEAVEFIHERIRISRENWRTRMYDTFQSIKEGIEM